MVAVHTEEDALVGPLLLATFLLGHAAIHLGFVAPAPRATASGPAWPFATESSWLVTRLGVDPDGVRDIAFALVTVIVGAFALAALVAIGIAPTAFWLPAAVIGSIASIALLAMCSHPWLILGVGIDIVLLYATLVAGWIPTTASIT